MYKKKATKAILVMLSLVIFSCGKKQVNIEKAPNQNTAAMSNSSGFIEIDNYNSQFLVFDNREELDLTLDLIRNYSLSELDSWSDENGVLNSRKYFTANTNAINNNDAVENDILSTVTNKDGIFQIGNIVYMHDLNTGRIWTLNLSIGSYSNLNDLINQNFIASCMNIYNIDEDDIISSAETGQIGVNQKKLRGIFGKDVHPTPITYSVNGAQKNFVLDWKSSYQNTGIIKMLQSKLRHYTGPANVLNPFNAPTLMGYNLGQSYGKYLKKGQTNWNQITGNKHWYPVAVRGKCDNRPYVGTKRISSCDFHPVWVGNDQNGISFQLYAHLLF
jgi:hypothetical protein